MSFDFHTLRITVGCTLLLALLLVDVRRHGRDSRRLHEYSFLFGCMLLVMVFCVLCDSVTSRISREYFTWGKALGNGSDFRTAVHLLALRAGWPAGLVIGACLLVANSVGKRTPLPPLRLFVFLVFPAVGAVTVGLIGGLIFRTDPFQELNTLPSWQTELKWRFLIVQGMHIGAYVGGALGTVLASAAVWRWRELARSVGPTDAVGGLI